MPPSKPMPKPIPVPAPQRKDTEAEQLLQVLQLLGEHTGALTPAFRAQHLRAALALMSSLEDVDHARIVPFVFLSSSQLLAACEAEAEGESKTGAAESGATDRNELVYDALFELITAACGCAHGDAARRAAADPPGAPATLQGGDGLFARDEPPYVLGDRFVFYPRKCRLTRKALHGTKEDAVRASLAHLLHAACLAAQAAYALRLRVAALSALSALARVTPPALLAAFFPGLCSMLARVLTRARLDQSALSVLAADALATALTRIFPRVEAPTGATPGDFGSLVSAMREKDVHAEADSEATARKGAYVSAVARDAKWYAEASNKFSGVIAAVLRSDDGPRWHSNYRSRVALVRLALSVLRKSRLQVSETPRTQAVVVLVEAAADDYGEVREISALAKLNADDLRDVLRATIIYISRTVDAETLGFEQLDEDDEPPQLKPLCAMLNKTDDDAQWTKLLDGFLRLLARKYRELLRRESPLDLARTLVAFEKACYKPRPVELRDERACVSNAALDRCVELGEAGHLPLLHGAFLEVAEHQISDDVLGDVHDYSDPDALINHAHTVLCASAVVRGAVQAYGGAAESMGEKREATEWAQLKRYVVGVLKCAALCALPSDEYVLNSAVWSEANVLRVKQAVLVNVARLISDIGVHKKKSTLLGFDFVMPMLVPLLVDAARSEGSVAQAAHHVMRVLASAVGYSGPDQLVGRHVNFVVARLVRNLHLPWAPSLLRYVTALQPDVAARVIDLAFDTIVQQCHFLAGATDEEAHITLTATEGILSVNLPEEELLPQRTVKTEEQLVQEDVDEMTNVMMKFCKEMAPQEEDVPLPGAPDDLDENEDGDAKAAIGEDVKKHLEHVGRDHNRVKTPFEQIADAALAAIADLLVGRPPALRAAALRTATLAVRVLASYRDVLLPRVAVLLPLIPPQLELEGEGSANKTGVRRRRSPKVDDTTVVREVNALGTELPVLEAACRLVTAFARTAGRFVQARFIKLIYPRMRPLLRLIRAGPHVAASFGALAAADAALECVASISASHTAALLPHAAELVGYVVPYLGVEADRPPPARHASNEARLRLEQRRARRRVAWAKQLVGALSSVAPDAVWCALVTETAPEDVLLHDVGRAVQVR